MAWVESLPGWVVFSGVLLIIGVVSIAINGALHRFVPAGQRRSVGVTATAYMTAVGSLFAILTGFLINSEYNSVRHAQDLVARETAAAARLAFATDALPAVDAALVQDALAVYLFDLADDEWDALARQEPQTSRAFRSLSDLQSRVFNIGSRVNVPASSVEGMRDAVSDLTSARRERVAIASESLPLPLFLLSVIAGLALIVNAAAVTLQSGRWTTLVAVGIVVIVALDLALILAISGPFQGSFEASRDPIAELYAEVRSGTYLPWIGGT